MDGTTTFAPARADDASRRVVEFVHGLLAAPAGERPPLADLLTGLATAFHGSGAACGDTDGTTLLRAGTPAPPWEGHDDFLGNAMPGDVRPLRSGSVAWLVTTTDGGLLVGVAAEPKRVWTTAEAAALALAAVPLGQRLRPVSACLQEQAAAATRRVAHDYGNVLTGVYGFSEMLLADLRGHPLGQHASEIHRAAQEGAALTDKLRLLSRRTWPTPTATRVDDLVPELSRRLRERFGIGLRLDVDLPADLAVGVGSEPLKALLAALLDNAAEAVDGRGSVRLHGRGTVLAPDDCGGLAGRAVPGPCVELRVEDDGPGLSPAAGRRLFVEPFFSTKPRRGGLGLGTVRGILYCHRGGLALGPGAAGGTIARVYLPAASAHDRAPRRPLAKNGPAALSLSPGSPR